MADQDIVALTVEIVSAHVANNQVATADLPALIQSVHAALEATTRPVEDLPAKPEPAVSVRASIKPDYLVCLEDGAKVKMLKRYLRTRFDLSPEAYRTKWGLPRDYPMVAPNYAEQRRSLAKTIGLGRRKLADAASAVVDDVKHGAEAAAAAIGLIATPEAPKAKRPTKPATVAAPKRATASKAKSAAATAAVADATPKKRGRPRKVAATPPEA